MIKELWDAAWQERIQGFRKISEKKCSTTENDEFHPPHPPEKHKQTNKQTPKKQKPGGFLLNR